MERNTLKEMRDEAVWQEELLASGVEQKVQVVEESPGETVQAIGGATATIAQCTCQGGSPPCGRAETRRCFLCGQQVHMKCVCPQQRCRGRYWPPFQQQPQHQRNPQLPWDNLMRYICSSGCSSHSSSHTVRCHSCTRTVRHHSSSTDRLLHLRPCCWPCLCQERITNIKLGGGRRHGKLVSLHVRSPFTVYVCLCGGSWHCHAHAL